MSIHFPDIDIDVANRTKILRKLNHVPASMVAAGEERLTRHNVGIYGQSIYADPFYGYASLTYKEAEELRYRKLDILNLTFLSEIESRAKLLELASREPDWTMLEDATVVPELMQIGSYSTLLKRKKPKSIIELAMLIAIIRPAKSHLQSSDWPTIAKSVWTKDSSGYQFRKSHGVAYAINIVIQMNLIQDRNRAKYKDTM